MQYLILSNLCQYSRLTLLFAQMPVEQAVFRNCLLYRKAMIKHPESGKGQYISPAKQHTIQSGAFSHCMRKWIKYEIHHIFRLLRHFCFPDKKDRFFLRQIINHYAKDRTANLDPFDHFTGNASHPAWSVTCNPTSIPPDR
ncbi:MAG: hypothetical protein AAF206_25230 [Bacteroidota bacterium]